MNPELGDFEDHSNVRPTLLTVLCILTFIGSAFGIVVNLYSYTKASQSVQQFQEIKKSINRSDSLSMADSVKGQKIVRGKALFPEKFFMEANSMVTVTKIHQKAIGDLIADLLTLAGAILMWNLRRTGYYIYILGIVIEVVMPLYLYQSNAYSRLLAIGFGFFGLLFIVLYALNLKSMRHTSTAEQGM